MTELVSSRGVGLALAERKARSMMRRFCMLGVSRQSGCCAASAQVTDVLPASSWSARTSRQ